MEEMTVYNRDMFVFVDETGSDRRDSLHRYGYSLRGKPARIQKLLVRGKRVSAIGALSASVPVNIKNGQHNRKTIVAANIVLCTCRIAVYLNKFLHCMYYAQMYAA